MLKTKLSFIFLPPLNVFHFFLLVSDLKNVHTPKNNRQKTVKQKTREETLHHSTECVKVEDNVLSVSVAAALTS